MKEKLKSRKFLIALFANIVSICAVFSDVGGITGTIFGIVGIVLSSISYMITEGIIDAERIKVDYDEIRLILNKINKKEGE